MLRCLLRSLLGQLIRALLAFFEYPGNDTFLVVCYLDVPEPQNLQSPTLQIARTLGVLLLRFGARMCIAIEFDHEPRCRAVAVENVRAKRMLTPEFATR